MSLRDWFHESRREISEFGVGGVRGSFSKLLVGAGKRVGRTVNYGESQMERDWDVLILLDACRPDYLRRVYDEEGYSFAAAFETTYSPASASIEWVQKCLQPLSDSEADGLAVVSGNGWTSTEIDSKRFHSVETLLESHWDEERGIHPPEVVTDHAIRTWREDEPERMLVWYMQPHTPHPTIDVNYEFETDMGDVTEDWTETGYARVGAISDSTLRRGYEETLKVGLAEVSALVENLDADDVYLSADHAELLGEWGLYEHPQCFPLPRLKRVPWVELTAEDRRTRPSEDGEAYRNDSELADRLRALGYRT